MAASPESSRRSRRGSIEAIKNMMARGVPRLALGGGSEASQRSRPSAHAGVETADTSGTAGMGFGSVTDRTKASARHSEGPDRSNPAFGFTTDRRNRSSEVNGYGAAANNPISQNTRHSWSGAQHCAGTNRGAGNDTRSRYMGPLERRGWSTHRAASKAVGERILEDAEDDFSSWMKKVGTGGEGGLAVLAEMDTAYHRIKI